jgi:hypothetical protein
MIYRVRLYCDECFGGDTYACIQRHPDVRSEAFESILAANTRGEELVAANDWEWEVLDDDGNIVC